MLTREKVIIMAIIYIVFAFATMNCDLPDTTEQTPNIPEQEVREARPFFPADASGPTIMTGLITQEPESYPGMMSYALAWVGDLEDITPVEEDEVWMKNRAIGTDGYEVLVAIHFDEGGLDVGDRVKISSTIINTDSRNGFGTLRLAEKMPLDFVEE